MITTTYNSPLGDITLAADARGLCGLWFAGQKHFGSTLSGAPTSIDMYTGELSAPVEPEDIAGCDAVSGAHPLHSEHPANTAAVSVLERTWAWLNAYFAGQAPRWIPPLHLEGTEFQHAVWVALLEIPYGQTTTYGALARTVGERMGLMTSTDVTGTSPRAVGGAVGRNPISIIVPCHRVLAADGSLNGYAGGIDRKRWLLDLEARGR